MKYILVLGAALIFYACSSTGVLPKGEETYTIGKKISPMFSGSPDDVRHEVNREAVNFCGERKAIETIKLEITPVSGFTKTGSIFLEFRCK
jgi:hypothetical protein